MNNILSEVMEKFTDEVDDETFDDEGEDHEFVDEFGFDDDIPPEWDEEEEGAVKSNLYQLHNP